MTIESFSTLKTHIGDLLTRPELASVIDTFISLGEARIYRDLRIRAMETALSETIASGVIAVPSGYKSLKYAYVETSPVQKLTRKDAEWVYQNYPSRSSGGVPQFIAREAGNFIFGPYPDSTYTVKGVYYARLTALSTDNETNWFTESAPDLLMYAALCEAEPYLMNDSRIQLWNSLYDRTKARVQAEDNSEELSGSVLMTSRG